MAIKVLIADDNPETRDNLKKLFAAAEDISVVAEVENGKDAITQCEMAKPDIVIMDINMPDMNGIEATEEITIKHPDISVIIISVQDEPEYLRKSMNAGAKDYFTKPFNPLELVSNIRKIYNREQKKQRGSDEAVEEKKEKGQVVTFFSTKGGCGKTSILVNMAVALKKNFPDKKIAILDLKLQFGDVDLMLDLKNPLTIYDLATDEALDFQFLNDYLSKHDTGVSVLAGPSKPQFADSIDPEFVRRLIACSRDCFDYVFIDSSSIIRENELCILDETVEGFLVLVLVPEVTSLKNTRETLEIVRDLGFPLERIRVLLNRGEQNLALTRDDIEKTLKIKIDALIPSDGNVAVPAVNRGQPFVVSNEGAKISTAVRDAVLKLFNLEAQKESSGFLDKLFKKK